MSGWWSIKREGGKLAIVSPDGVVEAYYEPSCEFFAVRECNERNDEIEEEN